MQAATFLQSLYLRYLAKPKHQRSLYEHVSVKKPRRILMIGLGTGELSDRILSLVLRESHEEKPRFAAVDLFEARGPESPGMTLKDAHCHFRDPRVEVRLVPGDPSGALARLANELRGTDLIVISAECNTEGFTSAWHLIARMLHNHSEIWLENPARTGYERLGPAEVRGRIPVRRGRAA